MVWEMKKYYLVLKKSFPPLYSAPLNLWNWLDLFEISSFLFLIFAIFIEKYI
jgi:hypothetical protein